MCEFGLGTFFSDFQKRLYLLGSLILQNGKFLKLFCVGFYMDFLNLIYGKGNVIQGLMSGSSPIFMLSVCKIAVYNWTEICDN